MLDFSRVQNYYIACGYTDMRKQIDGLAAVVELQFGKKLDETSVFLDHGEIEISNNQVENAIRPIVVGRKNWLFCDTQAGAKTSVTVFTVLETAKANCINPQTYLNHLLDVLPERFAENPKASIDDLMPWSDTIRERFAMQR
ncbi:MAG: transposase [Clostridia bacterium]|nr:transposase [Clostridia bacterium]